MNLNFKEKLFAGLLFLSVLLFSPNAYSDTVYLYTIGSALNPIDFTTGSGSIYGTVTWDATTGAVLNFNITTTPGFGGNIGLLFPGETYTSATYSNIAFGEFSANSGNYFLGLFQFSGISLNPLLEQTAPSLPLDRRFVNIDIIPTVLTTPEPSTYAIMAGGLLIGSAVAAMKRKKMDLTR